MWAGGARVRAEPFLHVGLVLVLSGLVFKYVGNLADLLVVGRGDGGSLLWGGQGRKKSSSRGDACRMWWLVLGRGGIQVG